MLCPTSQEPLALCGCRGFISGAEHPEEGPVEYTGTHSREYTGRTFLQPIEQKFAVGERVESGYGLCFWFEINSKAPRDVGLRGI